MNTEQIEKAAAEYRNDVLCDAALEVNYEENNYDAGYSDCIVEEIPKAFAKGAEWRINSVWHDVKEIPEQNEWIIAQFWDDCFDTYIMPIEEERWYDWCKVMGIKRWAYLDDLIPERKEGAE